MSVHLLQDTLTGLHMYLLFHGDHKIILRFHGTRGNAQGKVGHSHLENKVRIYLPDTSIENWFQVAM